MDEQITQVGDMPPSFIIDVPSHIPISAIFMSYLAPCTNPYLCHYQFSCFSELFIHSKMSYKQSDLSMKNILILNCLISKVLDLLEDSKKCLHYSNYIEVNGFSRRFKGEPQIQY